MKRVFVGSLAKIIKNLSPALVVDSFVVQDVVNGFGYDSVDGFEGDSGDDSEDGSVDDSVRGSERGSVVVAAEH